MNRLRLVAPPLLAPLVVFALGANGASAASVTGAPPPVTGPAPVAPAVGGASGNVAGAMGAGMIAMVTAGVVAARGIDALISPTFTPSNAAPSINLFGYAEPSESFAAFNKVAPTEPAFVPSWRVWTTGFGGSQTTSVNYGAGVNNDTTSRISGGMVGTDYSFSPDTLVGFALTGGGSDFSVANAGSGSSDLFAATLYARQNFGATYLSGSFSYGWQHVTSNRTDLGNRLSAEFDTNSYTGRIEAGRRFAVAGYGLTPYGAVQVTAIELPSYSETGTGTSALNFNGRSEVFTRSELGLRSDKSFIVTDAVVILSGRAAWAHDYNTNQTAEGTFASLPGSSFVVNGATLASDSALITASAKTSLRNGWSAELAYEGEFSNVTTSNGGRGTLSYKW